MRAGLPPGTLMHLGKKKTEKAQIDFISYNTTEIQNTTSKNMQEISQYLTTENNNWINIDGLHNVELIKEVGEYYNLNPLLLEDVVNADQRPKLEVYEKNIFFPLKALNTLKDDYIEYEQISLVLGKGYVISFQEKEGDLFDGLRTRMQQPDNRLRQSKADYLFYRLVDTIVDNYYIVMENLGSRIEDIEDEIFFEPSQNTLKKIQAIKKELIFLRKSLYPTREAVNQIIREEYDLFDERTLKFFADVYDHTIQIIEMFETYRDLTSSLMDTYMTTISNKMNEVMKVLTVISTIFIPLTFIAGIYGMNFHYMPELDDHYSYFVVLGLMLLMALGMVYYFKRKDWF